MEKLNMADKVKNNFRYLSKRDVEIIQKLNNDCFTPEKLEEWMAKESVQPEKLDKEVFRILCKKEIAEIITNYRMKSYAKGFLMAARLYNDLLTEIAQSESGI